MAPRPKSHFWVLFRLYFRRARVTVWLGLLVLLFGLIYLDTVGLPNVLKEPLVEKLRAKGLDLQFSRVRLSWYRGIVAEDVRFGQTNGVGPQLSLREARVHLNYRALLRAQLQVSAVALRKGRLSWAVAPTNGVARELVVTNIETDLRFLPNDQWALDHFRAQFGGGNLQVMGNIEHASALRNWKLLQPSTTPSPVDWQARIQRLSDVLDRIQFSAPPELKLFVQGDARDIRSFSLRLMASTPGARTPWGTVSHAVLVTRLSPAGSNRVAQAKISLQAADAQTPWANTTNFVLEVELASVSEPSLPQTTIRLQARQADTRWAAGSDLDLDLVLLPTRADTNQVSGTLLLRVKEASSKWATSTNLAISAEWQHSLTNPIPLSGNAHLTCDRATSDYVSGTGVAVSVRLLQTDADVAPERREPSLGWWTNLAPFQLSWACASRGIVASNVSGLNVRLGGTWIFPNLAVTNLQIEGSSGRLDAQAGLDVVSRAAQARLQSNLNPHDIDSLLGVAAQRWLGQFTWETPPLANGDVGLVLPPWTSGATNLGAAIRPSLNLAGNFYVPQGGTYRGLAATSARSHFSYSNECWHLPDLLVQRPEGELRAEHFANERTHEFYWRVESTLDPNVARPLLQTNETKVLDLAQFSQPPHIRAEIRGRSREPELTTLDADVALTNFSFRGQEYSGLQARVLYKDKFVQIIHPTAQRGEQRLSADGLLVDIAADRIYLTNGLSTAEPLAVAHTIGPHIARAIEKYEFLQPPAARVEGIIPLHGEEGADLRFHLEGGPFHWNKFHLPYITGDVHWLGLKLRLSNVKADFYGGAANGTAEFNFVEHQPTQFNFAMTTTNTLLQALMADYFGRTNSLEGTLNANLVVTRATEDDTHSVNGYGSLELHDGLVWDIPIFGIFSPVLNSISPGLGNSRASAATATFNLNKGVIRSDDLEVRAPGVRLKYKGDLDLDGDVKARVEAELLRDVWLVGPLVSTVLWPVTKMFEYKVTGSVNQPKLDPVFLVPKLMMLPFHPLKTLKSLAPEEPAGRFDPVPGMTNAPPWEIKGKERNATDEGGR